MSIYNRKQHQVPGLNTASLPDLIFTVLFFFMIVTHMRKVVLKVKYQVPQGTELTRLTKKSAVSYIYIGKPVDNGKAIAGPYCVQINDKYAKPGDVEDYMSEEKKRMAPEDQQQMTVSIKADKNTPMRLVTSVKQELRAAKTLRINYSATQEK